MMCGAVYGSTTLSECFRCGWKRPKEIDRRTDLQKKMESMGVVWMHRIDCKPIS